MHPAFKFCSELCHQESQREIGSAATVYAGGGHYKYSQITAKMKLGSSGLCSPGDCDEKGVWLGWGRQGCMQNFSREASRKTEKEKGR